ncbi:MAG: HpcH/HpaI aldolase/citrate lyase family protein [Campylobacterota bacterium]|nr:HpcH/HpaI aldolase/citrate lyase family protein [Campylobacterota bacterium]
MREVDYLHLGATLYIPATHKNLDDVVIGNRYPNLKSLVICLEDSISNDQLQLASKELQRLLQQMQSKQEDLYLFIRPRNLDNLKDIVAFKNIEHIDGFVLPKVTTTNLLSYIELIPSTFHLMPTLETLDVFDIAKLHQLKCILDNFKERIVSIRVGSEDILSLISIRRDSSMVIYDYIPFATILSNIINAFRPYGYNISSPVFNSFEESEVLKNELLRDVSLGIINKTIINPSQINTVHSAYRVNSSDLTIAQKLITTSQAIISFNGAMYERSTHLNWAKTIIKRGETYGVL